MLKLKLGYRGQRLNHAKLEFPENFIEQFKGVKPKITNMQYLVIWYQFVYTQRFDLKTLCLQIRSRELVVQEKKACME